MGVFSFRMDLALDWNNGTVLSTSMTTLPPTTTLPSGFDNSTIPSAPILPDPHKCNYYIVKNQTEFIIFNNPYGGIPQNLLIKFVGWLVLVLLFAILRRAAGNYGRLALIRHDHHHY